MLVLEETLVAVAVQRMRGLPEPVGLGTERQHMLMASFLPPLPASLSLDNPLLTSISRSLSLEIMVAPVVDCILKTSKSSNPQNCPPFLIYSDFSSLHREISTHLCHFVIGVQITESLAA